MSAELLLLEGQNHISEAVRLAETSIYADTYPRIGSFLRSSGLDLPVSLRDVPEPDGWIETLWNRWGFPERLAPPYIKGLEEGVDPTPVLIKEIKTIDGEIARCEQLNPNSEEHQVMSISAEIGLTRVVGVAVDTGNFTMAESVIARIRGLAHHYQDDMDLVAECLAYLGVAKMSAALSVSESK